MIARTIEAVIRRVANRAGFDITRYRPRTSATGRLAEMLAHRHVNLVFDVGANVGQFASELRAAGYRERMVSFEPLPVAWAQLSRIARHDPLWEVSRPVALGSEEGEIDINVAGNSVSSSVLKMLDSHSSAAPSSVYIDTARVPLSRLDTVAVEYLRSDSVPFLKIDTQGYEEQVLGGAPHLLERLVGVQLELSLVPLYAGQQLYRPLIDHLEIRGYDLWAIWPGFTDPVSGRMLQVDAVFFRR